MTLTGRAVGGLLVDIVRDNGVLGTEGKVLGVGGADGVVMDVAKPEPGARRSAARFSRGVYISSAGIYYYDWCTRLTMEGVPRDFTPILARLLKPAFGAIASTLAGPTFSIELVVRVLEAARTGSPVRNDDDLFCRGA